MNRNRLIAIAAMLMFALTMVAQETATKPSSPAKSAPGSAPSVPTAEDHLKILTAKLDLTVDQQAKLKPILQELHDASMKFVQDESMSRDERLTNVRAERQKADKNIREVLTDDQKKKLDQLEQGPHPELHGNVSGAAPSPQN